MCIRDSVINLLRRPDRLARFRNDCPLTDYQIINGFDVLFPNAENLQEFFFSNKFDNLHFIGEKGVWISHFRIWKYILHKNISNSLIFEDGAKF